MQRSRVQEWFSTHLHSTVFLVAYFLSTVAGNLIFVSRWANPFLTASDISSREFLTFPNNSTFGYWALLLCPFVLTPIIVSASRRLAGSRLQRAAQVVPEFRPWDYALIVSVCFGYVVYRFWNADVAALFASGADFNASINARFVIRERLGFFTLVLLQALLPYLAIYAFIAWLQSRRLYWMAFSIVDFALLSVLLAMTNMKWPVLLFGISIVLAFFVFDKRHSYLKTGIGALLVLIAFLLISTFVFRLPSSMDGAPTARAPSVAVGSPWPRVSGTIETAADHAPRLVLMAVNRMAISYPYYYQVFTEEGPVCGGILAQAQRKPACRPSELIFARMFGSRVYGTDDFESRGTSPMAAHISGYALGGWPVALLALVAGSTILGLFSALPLDKGPASGSLVILGAMAAYHLSQIPGEGVIFYEHGLLWTFLLIVGYLLYRWSLAPLADVLDQFRSH